MSNKEMLMYDDVVELGIATLEELNLVKNIMGGTWENVINMVISVRTGYRTYEQFLECEFNDDEF